MGIVSLMAYLNRTNGYSFGYWRIYANRILLIIIQLSYPTLAN